MIADDGGGCVDQYELVGNWCVDKSELFDDESSQLYREVTLTGCKYLCQHVSHLNRDMLAGIQCQMATFQNC